MDFSNPSSRPCYFVKTIFTTLAIAAGASGSWAGEPKSGEQVGLKTIESLFASSDLEGAQTQINTYVRTYPQSSLIPSVENIRGLIFLKQKRASQAIQAFNRALEASSNQSFRQYILYNLASAQLEGRAFSEADETLHQVHPELLDQTNRLKLITLQVAVYEKMNQPLEAVRFLSGLAKNKSESENQELNQLLSKLFKQSVQWISDPASLDKLLQDSENQPLADVILLRLATLEVASGATASAATHLKKIIESFPNGKTLDEAQEILNQIRQTSTLDRNAIGVLLPLKGKLSKFGSRTLQGIELALDIFSDRESRTPLKLVVEDSGDEPESAVQALNRLALKHHVVAVIGPMLSKGVDAVTQRAQELGIPLLSLSRRASVLKQEYVFHSGATQQMQAHAVARHAIQTLGLKKLAILYPNDKLGSESSQAFWDAVESLGGEIVGFESYYTTDTDFRLPIDKLSGLFYTDARQNELDQLAKDRDVSHITKRTRKTEQYFALKPVVNYQAVFIPDEAKKLGQIMPTFSYRDVEGIKFLGSSEWNSSEFLSRSQSYGENTFFVDAFFSDTASGPAKKFLEDYRATFDQEPSALEAIAYDAASLLKFVFSSNPSGMTRSELRDRLIKIEDFAGATGKISYKNGQLFRDLKILTIKGGKIRDARS